MSVRIRPLELDDEAPLAAIDQRYAEAQQLPPIVRAAALSYFARTGHAFVAEARRADATLAVAGFVLAHALWDGWAPSVQIVRLVATDERARHALLEACVKSAYDAAVKHLAVDAPASDAELLRALSEHDFARLASVRHERRLGAAAGA